MIEQLYFCTECKKNIGPTNDILFVQEKNAKGFCSEHCIDQHYGNIRQAVQLIEYEKRAELGLDSKEGLKVLRPDEHKSQLLFSPMEILVLGQLENLKKLSETNWIKEVALKF